MANTFNPDVFRAGTDGEPIRFPSDIGKPIGVLAASGTRPAGLLGPIPLQSVGLAVANFAQLTALAGAAIGSIVRVESVGRSFQAIPPATSTPEAAVVLNSDDGLCQWQTLEGTSDAKWLAQLTWYIDGTSGDDENEGSTPAAPLATATEIQRRWASRDLTASPQIYIVKTPADGAVNLGMSRTDPLVIPQLLGITEVIAAGVVTTYTAQSSATKEAALLTSVDIADWTPYVGKRLNFSDLGWARVIKANPGGAGVNVARISQALFQDGNPRHHIANYTPTVGANFTIEEVPDVGSLSLHGRGALELSAGPNYHDPYWYVRTIMASKSSAVRVDDIADQHGAKFYDCDLTDFSTQSSFCGTYGGSLRWSSAIQCISVHDIYNAVVFRHPTGAASLLMFRCFNVLSTTFQGIGIAVAAGPEISFGNVFVFESPAGQPGLKVNWGTLIRINANNFISGKDNATTGLSMLCEARIVKSSGAVLNITGAAGDWKIEDGTAAGTFTWAATPARKFDRGSATTTLVGGSSPAIAIENFPADAVVIPSANTFHGTPGPLSAPAASRSAAGLTVVSESATDESDVDVYWFSPGAGTGSIVQA